MIQDVGERRLILPTKALMDEFRSVVEASVLLVPIDPKIIVEVDEYGHAATLEAEATGYSPGEQRAVIDTYYYLDRNGKLTKDQEGEPLGMRLARDIKAGSVNPSPNAYQQEVDDLRAATGCTEEDAKLVMAEVSVFLCSDTAISSLMEYVRVKRQQQNLGLNVVDAFELADVIRKIGNNFPVFRQ